MADPLDRLHRSVGRHPDLDRTTRRRHGEQIQGGLDGGALHCGIGGALHRIGRETGLEVFAERRISHGPIIPADATYFGTFVQLGDAFVTKFARQQRSSIQSRTTLSGFSQPPSSMRS